VNCLSPEGGVNPAHPAFDKVTGHRDMLVEKPFRVLEEREGVPFELPVISELVLGDATKPG
jgi:hypothetical protein